MKFIIIIFYSYYNNIFCGIKVGRELWIFSISIDYRHFVLWQPCLCMLSSDLSSVHGELASVRAELLTFLTHVLLGDSLAAEYLILHLISNVYVSHFKWLCCMSEVWPSVACSPRLIYGTNLSIYNVYFGKSYAYLLDVLWSFSTVTCFLHKVTHSPSDYTSWSLHCLNFRYSRRDVLPLGKFTLNLSGCPHSSPYTEHLYKVIQQLVPSVSH